MEKDKEKNNTKEQKTNRILHGDSLQLIKIIPDESVHLIVSDIPYGIGAEDWDVLHNNSNSAFLGKSPAQEKAGKIFQKRGKPLNGWSSADKHIAQEYYNWCSLWAADWFRILKPGASAFVFAGRRLSHRSLCALEDAGFTFRDMLAWNKEKAAHRAQRLSVVYQKRGDNTEARNWQGWKLGNLRPVFEPILWFSKPYPLGTTLSDNMLQHGVGAFNEKEFLKYIDKADNLLRVKADAQDRGLHPTQKPLRLLQALIALSSQEEQVVLDPFCGSGTTLLAAAILKRKYLGIESQAAYCQIASQRLKNLAKQDGE